MRKTSRTIWLLTAAVLAALLLAGCGQEAGKEAENEAPDPLAVEDQLIREAMAAPGGLRGDKLAIYDKDLDRYSFNGGFIPDSLRAQTPEEIGAFVCYSGKPSAEVWLTGAFSGKTWYRDTLAGIYLSTGSISEQVTAETSLNDFILNKKNIAGYMEYFTPNVLQEERWEQISADLNDSSGDYAFGDGQYFVGYNEDTGEYSMDRIPSNMRAASLEDIGYILSYFSTKTTKTEEYRSLMDGTISERTVPLEVFHGRILVAATGENLGAFEKTAIAPGSIDASSDTLKTTDVSPDLIADELRSEFYYFIQHNMIKKADWLK